MLSARSKKNVQRKYGYKPSRLHARANSGILKKKNTKKSRRRSLVLGVVSVIISVFFLFGFSLFNFINAPFSNASDNYYLDKSIWDKDEDSATIFVAYVNDLESDRTIQNFYLFKGDGQSNNYYIYNFPVNIEIEIPNAGKTTLQNMYFEQNKILSHDEFINKTTKFVINYLAVEPTGYILMDKRGFELINHQIKDIDFSDIAVALRLKNTFKIPNTAFIFRDNAITNLNMGDVYHLLSFFKNTARGGGKVISLTMYELLDQAKWDSRWAETIKLSTAKKDGVKIFILNASKDPKIPGLAAWGSRLAKNIGATVMDTTNSFTDYQQNTIITDDINLKTSEILGRLLKISNVQKISELPTNDLYNPEIFRAKVTLVLIDYFK